MVHLYRTQLFYYAYIHVKSGTDNKILSRLKAAQEELDSHLGRQSSEPRQNERSQQEDNPYYQFHQASPRVLAREGLGRDEERVISSYPTNDIPLRFHAGRE